MYNSGKPFCKLWYLFISFRVEYCASDVKECDLNNYIWTLLKLYGNINRCINCLFLSF